MMPMARASAPSRVAIENEDERREGPDRGAGSRAFSVPVRISDWGAITQPL